jgi:hypothetical protein
VLGFDFFILIFCWGGVRVGALQGWKILQFVEEVGGRPIFSDFVGSLEAYKCVNIRIQM